MTKNPQWGDGPWNDEPDRVEWRAHGFPCLIVRAPLGHLCGYVGVPPEHPEYDEDSDHDDLYVHGGITYAEHCQGAICHVPAPGEPDDVLWLGFDCGHSGDISPRLAALGSSWPDDIYRDIEYVRRETERLAEQLAARSAR